MSGDNDAEQEDNTPAIAKNATVDAVVAIILLAIGSLVIYESSDLAPAGPATAQVRATFRSTSA